MKLTNNLQSIACCAAVRSFAQYALSKAHHKTGINAEGGPGHSEAGNAQNHHHSEIRVRSLIVIAFLLQAIVTPAEAVFDLNGRKATVKTITTSPTVESDYAKRFKFDAATNPKLKQLREQYKLDEVIAPGKDEFEKQILLMDWVHHRFKKFGRPSTDARGVLDVLKAIDEGHRFFCTQYGQVMISCAASLGWVDRGLALRRHKGVNKIGGSTEHTTTEIWSNQHSKWIMLDPTSNMYLEKDGVPLNAWEIRQDWFHNRTSRSATESRW